MEALKECPYDKSHMIAPLRMPQHLLRCRKNYPYMEMVVCPFNATHEVHKVELRYHMTHCPDRTILENQYSLDLLLAASDRPTSKVKGCTDLPNLKWRRPDSDMVGDEWDIEAEQNGFSQFQNDPDSEDDEIPLRRFRQRDENLEQPRRPVTLGEAARLAQASQEDQTATSPQTATTTQTATSAQTATSTQTARLSQVSQEEDQAQSVQTATSTQTSTSAQHSSLFMGRGRARTVASLSSVPAKPGVSYPSLNSQLAKSQSVNSSATRPGLQYAPSIVEYLCRGRGVANGRGRVFPAS